MEPFTVVARKAAQLVEAFARRVADVDLDKVGEDLDRDIAAGRDLGCRALGTRQGAGHDPVEADAPEGFRDDLRLLAAARRERAIGPPGEDVRGVRLALAVPHEVERRRRRHSPSSPARALQEVTRLMFGWSSSRFQVWSNSHTLIPASASDFAMSTSSSQNASSSSSFASRTLDFS